jgi:Na+/H+ antiporter NhaD/arsenite permease-like protein
MQTVLILSIFAAGYLAIILENLIKLNKAAIAIFMAVCCWAVFFLNDHTTLQNDMNLLNLDIASVAQIVFYLIGAMAIVEVIDSHKGFKIITDVIQTKSKRKMLWLISFVSFFLSAVLDNLTATILMVSLLRKIIPNAKDRIIFCCLVVVAANAGGAWTPIGDVTTTMLWIEGQLSSLPIMTALFLPSLVSALIPLCYFTFRMHGRIGGTKNPADDVEEPGAKLVFWLGMAGLIFVPIFKAWTGLPPFMGVLISLAFLWLVTDGLHFPYEKRRHLRVPHILTKIDISGVLFFLGILLSVGALDAAHLLHDLATKLGEYISSLPVLATLIGILSAIIDNVPLVAASMGMYPIEQFPTDHPLWMMIAYAAGTGGSLLIIGSSAGVALMGMEKIDFLTYMKKMTLPVLVGYLAGMGVYLLQSHYF